MAYSSRGKISPKEHITAIFEDYEASARVLQTLTNLSNTVIETALRGQCKFLYEIFQNADDAFDEPSKFTDIKLQLDLLDNYLIIQHNGKAFDYNDVERICDYASQIEEVKANDLSKTGYKGLGFKSLFNLSDCIYIRSNGYSFRFDRSFWSDPKKNPWQVIPIWSENLPLNEKFSYDQPVCFIMQINDMNQLNTQLKEVIEHPEVLLHLHRINSFKLNLNGTQHILERKIEKLGIFNKILILKNKKVVSTWIARTYEKAISVELRKCIQEVSRFIFPDKIKNAKEVFITFTLCTSDTVDKVLKINGLCYSTLPTQLQLSLPYHVNSLFILNLDRTQFHENEWNEFLVYQIGFFQLRFLQDLAEMPYMKNYVIELLLREIKHPYNIFNKAFSKGFVEAKTQIAWLPSYKGCLLKLGEAYIDKIHFFQQNFQNIQDKLCEYVIDYDVKSQNLLLKDEAKSFDYNSLFEQFPHKYYPQLTESSYMKFLSYIYEISKKYPLGSNSNKLSKMPLLKTRNKTLTPPTSALLEIEGIFIPDFAELNPVDNNYLPVNDTGKFKDWLVGLGAKRLDSPVKIIRESIFQWIKSGILRSKMNINNHKTIINYLAENYGMFYYDENEMLKKNLLILTKSNNFKIATKCYLPNAIALDELGKVMSDDELISSTYDIDSLKPFFSYLGISNSLSSIEIFRKCILEWIKNGVMRSKLTTKNYKPIIEFLSSEYQKIRGYLSGDEKKIFGEMPVLTRAQDFRQARYSYFDTVIPKVQGFEDSVEENILVCTQNVSDNVIEFLSYIGVSKNIDQVYIIRNTVLKWIQNGTVQNRINSDNHHGILEFVADFWYNYSYQLQASEKEQLKKLPVVTKSNNFREISVCYWQTTCAYESDKEIPKVELIVSENELVSSEYYELEKKRPCNIEQLLNDLGVRSLKFNDIYDRYCDHLTDLESVQWFFSKLKRHWETYKTYSNKGDLLNNLYTRLRSSHLLAKNGKLYLTTEIYSSYFLDMHNIDENAVPILAFGRLPKELEDWIGIRQKLDLPCIVKLMEAIDKRQSLGEEVTLTFYKTLLEQLQKINKTDIRKYPLKLLSNDNKLILATDLYYFREEDAVCLADCYLKRIHGMSHDETLKLAELCGVNLLEFRQEVTYGEDAPTCDKSLREFYLERLPLTVLQESKILYESTLVVLKKLLLKIESFELYKCQKIFIKYPFGEAVETRCYFENMKIYIVGNWKNLRTKIHMYIKEKLELNGDITEILDLESVSENKAELLYYQKEDPQKLLEVEEELNKLRQESNQEKTTENSN